MRGSTIRFLRRDSRPENGTIRRLRPNAVIANSITANLRTAEEITRTPIEGAKD